MDAFEPETRVDEIAEDIFRICTYVKSFDLGFNVFLIRDDEPLLFHLGLNLIFPKVHEAVGSLIDVSRLRWLAFSHYGADECGSINRWLELAPQSTAACSVVGKRVSVDDVALRPARELLDGEVIETGKRRFRFLQTPHLPHGWDAGLMFEETTRTLLCSDLGTHHGEVEPIITEGLGDRTRHGIEKYADGPMDHAHVWTPRTESTFRRLASLQPRTLAIMHGSSFQGDGAGALLEAMDVWREMLAPEPVGSLA